MKIKSNVPGCVDKQRCMSQFLGNCLACYYSQVKGGSWIGSDKCYESNCLVLEADEQEKVKEG